MNKKVIGFTIDQTGNYTLEAKEGFAGTSCVAQTAQLELVLGGASTDEGKKPEYYDKEESIDINITF